MRWPASIRAVHRPYGLDVSNANPITQPELVAANPLFLVGKATEGSGFVDGTYDHHRQLAAQLKIPFGSYLFLHPSSQGNEAQFFLEHAKPRSGDLQPWIDAEVRDGAPFSTVAARVDSCAKVLERNGLQPLLYSYTSFLQDLLEARPGLKRLRVMQAAYTAVRPRVGHGASVVGWQYTDRLPVGSGLFDASRLFVPLDSLRIDAKLNI